MKRNVLALVAVVAVTALSSASKGASPPGALFSAPVTVDTTNMVATGSMGSALHSGDGIQNIGCVLNYTLKSSGAETSVACGATDASGNTINCTATSPDELLAVATITPDSYVRFTWGTNSSGTVSCTEINITNDSRYLLK
jgi:hypothetical protein